MHIPVSEEQSATLPAPGSERPRAASTRFWLSVATIFAVAIIYGIAMQLSLFKDSPTDASTTSPIELSTEVAQHATSTLEDGTQLFLGAKTKVTFETAPTHRLVTMGSGEALFHIAHDANRPFRILAGGRVITALGGEFNVRALDSSVTVTVNAGTIEVNLASEVDAGSGVQLSPGQRVARGQSIIFDRSEAPGTVAFSMASNAAAWRDGQLSYESAPLREVIQDVNRYSMKTVAIEDGDIGELLFSGTIFERDIDDWLAALDQIFPDVEIVTVDERRVVIRRRRADRSDPNP